MSSLDKNQFSVKYGDYDKGERIATINDRFTATCK